MARKKKTKTLEVQKFGGTEEVGKVKMEEQKLDGTSSGYDYDLSHIEAESKTKLEDDIGIGAAVVIRHFEFGINAEAFKKHPPTHQELFNSHLKGIEIALWKDGLAINPDIPPRIVIDEKGMRYHIFIASKPSKGHILPHGVNPQTLKQIAHG